MRPGNPFLPAPAEPKERSDALEADPVMPSDAVSVLGPQSPVYAPRVEGARLEVATGPTQSGTALITVVGLHGGAGASTLAALLGADAHDAGQTWPELDPWVTEPNPTLVIAVARTHRRGLDAASTMLEGYIHDELPSTVHLLGVCLVADGPVSKGFDAKAVRRVASAAPRGWFLAWNENFRHGSITSSGLRIPKTLVQMKNCARKTRRTR